MNVRNCRKCGNLFNYVSGPPICMACREKLEEKFQEVKKYIQDNGHAGIQQVAEACDVSTNQIHLWLREERLDMFTTVFIGNSATGAINGWMVTPRGYRP